ncbi:hypothetical protein L227DRAFT_514559, partial [Lentinus tigrinus ALCF2SS1-6]
RCNHREAIPPDECLCSVVGTSPSFECTSALSPLLVHWDWRFTPHARTQTNKHR